MSAPIPILEKARGTDGALQGPDFRMVREANFEKGDGDMRRILFLAGAVILLVTAGSAFSQTVSSSPTAVAAVPTGTVTPSAKPAHRKKKKKAVAVPTVQATQTTTPAVAQTLTTTPAKTAAAVPTATPVAAAKPLVKAEAIPTAGTAPDTQLADADKAYAARDFATAMAGYGDYVKAHGKTPTVEKKLLLSKFYAGASLETEARDGIKSEESYIQSDSETHNIEVYGKKQPTRDDHLVTLSLAFLTPQLLGGDIGVNFLAHWNVGMGISPLGVDPRIKYYFNGDNASFFLGVGYATYNLDLSKLGISGDAGEVSFNGNFLHFTFGPSFQDKNGFFMEIPFDLGLANFTYVIPDGNGTPKPGSYNGPAGTIGFRFGLSI